MTDFNKLVESLSSEDISSLMFSLCRSGKVIIPQFFTDKNMETISGDEPGTPVNFRLMTQIQKDFECDDNFIDMMNEKIYSSVEIFHSGSY